MATGIRGRRWLPSGRVLGIVAVVTPAAATATGDRRQGHRTRDGHGWSGDRPEVVGFSVRTPVKDWWLAREACGGKLSADDLATVRTEARLGAERESFDKERGRYNCLLEDEPGKVVVAVDAYPDGPEREKELAFECIAAFTGQALQWYGPEAGK